MSFNTADQTALPEEIAYLRSAIAIRERCGQLFALACADKLRHFRCDLSQLDPVADYVIQVTRQHYPDLNIPFHSRWRHFEVGDASRLTSLNQALAELSPLDRAKAKFDLVIISVLLDAGADAAWRYVEPSTGQTFQRSEGLAIASFQMFRDGLFSKEPGQLQVDAIALQNLTENILSQGFQVTSTNPLVGLQGRLNLLQRLGHTLQNTPTLFGTDNPRPGNLVDYLQTQAQSGQLPASIILNAILTGLGDIWAGRLTLAGITLGDVWPHSALNTSPPPIPSSPSPYPLISPSSSSPPHPTPHTPHPHIIPFHKLSQWLTYSLLEPLQELGLEITGLDELTGLPEYRNGGLCLDLGLLRVKDPSILQRAHPPSSEVIVEWRALTVILLDQIANTMRQKLNLSSTELPLVKVLQGGTWTAGRQIAAELRPGGVPPIQIESDGTVF